MRFEKQQSSLLLWRTPYLHRVQRLSILQPTVRRFGLGTGFAFPNQSVINGLLNILRLFSQVRCSCEITQNMQQMGHFNGTEELNHYQHAAVSEWINDPLQINPVLTSYLKNIYMKTTEWAQLKVGSIVKIHRLQVQHFPLSISLLMPVF